jgi:diguanylate cyclase (GGDEF)-like protein/PAS domain S-box-containing protein
MAQRPRAFLIGAAVLAAIGSLSLINYLLFHTVVELANIVVAGCVFILAWNFRDQLDNGYFLIVGVASLFVSGLNLLHTLAYKGMAVFPGYGANLATELYLASRFLQSITLLAAPFFIGRKPRVALLLPIGLAATAGLTWLVFTGHVPTAYVDGSGLTPFKRESEYVVGLVLAGALGLLLRQARAFDPRVMRFQAWSIGLSLAAGFAFTLYVGVYDIFNLIGHLLQLLSGYLLYAAVVETGLNQPFTLLFRNLKQSEEALRRERNFAEAVLRGAGALILVLDREGQVLRFNRACQELTGYSEGEMTGHALWEWLVPPDEADAARERLVLNLQGTSLPSFERRWITRGGEERLIWWASIPLLDDAGQTEFVILSGIDITERRRMEQELHEREERLRVIVESVPTGVLLIDRQRRTIQDANPAAAAMTGLPAAQLIGRPCATVLACYGQEGKCPCEGDALEAPSEARLLTAQGTEMPVHRTVAAVTADGREQLLESFVDMSRYKLMEEELRKLTLVDELTGLHNRRGFLALSQHEIDLSVRLGRGLYLLFVDLGGLNEIVETWDHATGDLALKTAARIIREAFGNTGLAARIGGGEFVVLTPQYAGTDPAMLRMRLQQRADAYNATLKRFQLRFSVGVAELNPAKPCSIQELLTQADTDLYLARRMQSLH